MVGCHRGRDAMQVAEMPKCRYAVERSPHILGPPSRREQDDRWISPSICARQAFLDFVPHSERPLLLKSWGPFVQCAHVELPVPAVADCSEMQTIHESDAYVCVYNH